MISIYLVRIGYHQVKLVDDIRYYLSVLAVIIKLIIMGRPDDISFYRVGKFENIYDITKLLMISYMKYKIYGVIYISCIVDMIIIKHKV